jgi:hypothetical protein
LVGYSLVCGCLLTKVSYDIFFMTERSLNRTQ